jgi:hypothetical protein
MLADTGLKGIIMTKKQNHLPRHRAGIRPKFPRSRQTVFPRGVPGGVVFIFKGVIHLEQA